MGASEPALQVLSQFDAADDVVDAAPISSRGVLWVMKWASTAATLFCAATMLAEFAYSLAAARMLARAARAGVLEATLPRATFHSVKQSIERRLAGRIAPSGAVTMTLLNNSAPATKKLQPRGGDRLSITLAMPGNALMPGWLRALTAWRGAARIVAHAERTMPGRQLAAFTN